MQYRQQKRVLTDLHANVRTKPYLKLEQEYMSSVDNLGISFVLPNKYGTDESKSLGTIFQALNNSLSRLPIYFCV